MKTKLALLLPILALPLLSGCASDGLAKVVRELKNDPATVDLKIVSPWGVGIDFHRSNPGFTNQPAPAK